MIEISGSRAEAVEVSLSHALARRKRERERRGPAGRRRRWRLHLPRRRRQLPKRRRSGRGGGIGIVGILIILGLMLFFGVDPTRASCKAAAPAATRCELPRYPAAAVAPRHHQFPGARHARAADRASQDLQRGRPQAVRRRWCSPTPRTSGSDIFRAVRRAIQRPEARAVFRRRALGLRLSAWRRWGRSTVPTTRRSISTSASTRS